MKVAIQQTIKVQDYIQKEFCIGTFLLLCLLTTVYSVKAQEVNSSIDSTSIKIGEQLTYQITVEADTADIVVFPEEQTFMPLEMVEAFEIDTTAVDERFQLIREYALTQFDSGSYTIPRQKILIGDKELYTDSLQVVVNDVVVDTTKQKMFPVKPSVEIKEGFSIPKWIWWVLGILIVLGLLIFLLLKRKKRIEEAKRKLPPYEQAMLTLTKLDESSTLERSEIKDYYSVLTEAVKRYIDEKIDERALESTTDELILRLKEHKNANKLYLKEHTLQTLEAILKRADLAKFAGIATDKITAKADRKSIEENINDLEKAIPEPTEEELEEDIAYQETQLRKRKKRKRILIIASAIVGVLIITGVFIGKKGFDYVTDVVFASASEELLQKDWIASEYGNPAVSIITPEVLVRQEKIPEKLPKGVTGEESFSSGTIAGNFYVNLSTMRFKGETKFDINESVDILYEELEAEGARNIVMKDEEFTTPGNAKGVKAYGSFTIESPVSKRDVKKEYMILNFGENGGFQQVLLIHDEKDEAADEITSRIINSVEFNTKS